MSCPAINDDAFARSVIAHLDCQSEGLGASGFGGLSSHIGALLIASLTLFVALYGYGLLLGRKPSFEQLGVNIVRIGFVLMLASSWPAFQTLVYNVTLNEPAVLADQISGGTATARSTLDLAQNVQALDDQIDEFVQRGSGVISPLDAGQVGGGATRRVDAARDWSLAATARILFLGSTIGGVAVVRFLEALLLALGPIFAITLLFESSIGLFIGWLRGLIACLAGSFALIILVRGQSILVGPWLAQILVYRRAEIATPAVPAELLALCLIFAIATFGLLLAIGAIAWSLRLPNMTRLASSVVNQVRTSLPSRPSIRPIIATTDPTNSSHAIEISRSIMTLQERRSTMARATATSIDDRREHRGNGTAEPLRYGQNMARSANRQRAGSEITMRKSL